MIAWQAYLVDIERERWECKVMNQIVSSDLLRISTVLPVGLKKTVPSYSIRKTEWLSVKHLKIQRFWLTLNFMNQYHHFYLILMSVSKWNIFFPIKLIKCQHYVLHNYLNLVTIKIPVMRLFVVMYKLNSFIKFKIFMS